MLIMYAISMYVWASGLPSEAFTADPNTRLLFGLFLAGSMPSFGPTVEPKVCPMPETIPKTAANGTHVQHRNKHVRHRFEMASASLRLGLEEHPYTAIIAQTCYDYQSLTSHSEPEDSIFGHVQVYNMDSLLFMHELYGKFLQS